MSRPVTLHLTVNQKEYSRFVEPRLLLSDFLRHELGLTGTHVGCEHGVCGACTVLFDGESVRSCLMFAVQANGHSITTVEGLSAAGSLHPIQQSFWEAHGLQCGYCTPGILMTLVPFLGRIRIRRRSRSAMHSQVIYAAAPVTSTSWMRSSWPRKR
jgi:carbon-monoxide dehydrogenase small subunit